MGAKRAARSRAAIVATAVLAAALVGAPTDAVQARAQAGQSFELAPLPEGTPRFIDAAIRDLLGRASTPADRSQFQPALDAGGSRIAFARTLARTEEWSRVVVQGLYAQILKRSPDGPGLAHWAGKLAGGARTADLATQLYASNEFFVKAGGTSSTYVDGVFQNLLGRAADPGGTTYWTTKLDAGAPRTTVARQVFLSIEANGRRVDSLYLALLNRSSETSGRSFWAKKLVTVDDLELAGELVGSGEYLRAAQQRFQSASATTVAGAVILVEPEVEGIAVAPDGSGTVTLVPGVAAPTPGTPFVASMAGPAPVFATGFATGSAATGGGATELSFRRAALEDVFSDLRLRSTVEIPDLALTASRAGGVGSDPSPDGTGGGPCGGSAELGWSPTAAVRGVRPDVDIDLGLTGYSAKVLLRFTAEVGLTLDKISAGFECSVGVVGFQAIVLIGPIPVPIAYGTIDIGVSASGSWDAVGLTAKVTSECKVGFEAAGTRATPIFGCTVVGTRVSNTPKAYGSLEFAAFIRPRMGLGISQFGTGLYGEIKAAVSGSAKPGTTPWGTIDFNVDGSFGAEVNSGPVRQTWTWASSRWLTKRLWTSPTTPPAPKGRITRVTNGNSFSNFPSISADGRYVAYESSATNLGPSVPSGTTSIYLYDRVAGTTKVISTDPEDATHPSISANGRYVAYSCQCNDGAIKRWDRLTGTTITVVRSGSFPTFPSISADGNVLADGSRVYDISAGTRTESPTSMWRTEISADGSTLVGSTPPADGTPSAVYRWRVGSASATKVTGSDHGKDPSISNDLSRIAFTTQAGNGTLERARSSTGNGAPADLSISGWDNQSASVSGDGSCVTWSAGARDGSAYRANIYVNAAGRLTQATNGNLYSADPRASANCRYIAFWSWASDLVPGPDNGYSDIFIWDRGY